MIFNYVIFVFLNILEDRTRHTELILEYFHNFTTFFIYSSSLILQAFLWDGLHV